MPTSTRPAHVSNARKAARRSRRLRSSARRLNQQPSAAPPNRRPAKRRRLRDQESMNLQECLYDCQDQGYHLDQDVRVGHGVSLNGSHFALLDLDVTDPTAPFESSSSSITNAPTGCAGFTHPDPSLCAKASEQPTQPLLFSTKGTHRPSTDVKYSTPPSPPLPSIPTTPDAAPRVRLPDPYPGPVREECARPYRPGFLDNIHIPSPMLWKSQSGDNLALSIERDFPRFELAYSQPRPDPDFTGYPLPEDSDGLSEDGSLLRSGESHFVAASVPLMGRTVDKPTTAYYIPCGQRPFSTINNYSWALDSANFFPAQYPSYAGIDRFPMPGRYPTSMDDVIPRQLVPYRNPLLNVPVERDAGDDPLVIPKLHPEVSIEDSTASKHSPNNVVEPWANPAAGGDCNGTGDRASMCGLLSSHAQVSDRLDSTEGQSPTGLADSHQLESNAGSTRSPITTNSEKTLSASTSDHTDTVSARLHWHQVRGWSYETGVVDSGTQVSCLSQPNVDRQISRIGCVSKMAEWLQGLNRTNKAGTTAGEAGQADVEGHLTLSAAETLEMAPDAKGSQNQAEDEAYYTADECAVDVELVSGGQSEDEWADWDWEFESNGEAERIGLYATDWEG